MMQKWVLKRGVEVEVDVHRQAELRKKRAEKLKGQNLVLF